jgi:hypothetical protein
MTRELVMFLHPGAGNSKNRPHNEEIAGGYMEIIKDAAREKGAVVGEGYAGVFGFGNGLTSRPGAPQKSPQSSQKG